MFVDRWQPMLFGKIHDALPVSVEEGSRADNERLGAGPLRRLERAFELFETAHGQHLHPSTE
jgi:hypothetical protein